MNKLFKLTVVLTILSTLLGPSIRLPGTTPPVNIYISDILVAFLSLLLAINYPKAYLVFKKDQPSRILAVFIVYSLFTLIVTPLNLNLYERIVSFLYLLRFTLYFGIYISCLILIREDQQQKFHLKIYLNLTGIFFIILGWLQYFIYPDLRNLAYLGWDPHFK